ncbi:hypothetical protein ACFLXY_01475 [Chloroflexota bacterium]
MITHSVFWWIFIAFLSFWIMGKARRYLIDKNTNRVNKEILEAVNDRLEKLDINITDMSKNIKQQSKQLGKLTKALNKINETFGKKDNEL